MKKHVVILGAGFGGLELAACLCESLADAVDVTLIDRSDTFHFGFAKLDVLLGRRAAGEILLPYGEISRDGLEFRQETVTAIDPARRHVVTDNGSYDADILVVALGARYDYAATPGFEEGGFEYYSLAGAERLRDALAAFESGTILLSILGQPFKCPPAPFEGAFLLHQHFVDRGIRDAVEIRMTFPMSRPVPVTDEVSAQFRAALEERDIVFQGEQRVTALNPDEQTAELEGGETIPYDLFVGVPIHRVPEVVASSGLADGGWVQVDQSNLRTPFPAVYAIGDVAGGPRAVPKAGIFAESAARVVAADIAAELTGAEPPAPWEGTGNCYAEFGDGIVGKVEVNFLGGPKPAARLVQPSREIAAEKKAFGADRRSRWFGS